MFEYPLGKRWEDGETLSLSTDERRRHLYISGSTGVGKTSLLKDLIKSDLKSGRGLILLDPHGDFAREIADSIPPERINDVIYFDPLDPTHVVGFNPLRKVDRLYRSAVAAQITSAFRLVWKDYWGPRVDYVAKNAIALLLSTHSTTLLDIPPLLVDGRFRRKLLRKCDDPGIKFFWEQEYAKLTKQKREEWIGPLQNKAGQFRSDAILRAVVGQRTGLDMAHVMNNKGILICNLSKAMGDEPSRLLGAFLTIAMAQAADQRALIREEERQDITAYIDEFQNYATDVFATMLSEARKMRVNLVTANQFLSQLPDLVQDAVFGNVGTYIVFRVGANDAGKLGRQLGVPSERAVIDLPNFMAWIKLLRNGSPTDPKLMALLPPAEARHGSFQAVVANTHASHARPRSSVEADVAKRLTRPDLPEIDWQA